MFYGAGNIKFFKTLNIFEGTTISRGMQWTTIEKQGTLLCNMAGQCSQRPVSADDDEIRQVLQS
jgi:hypothetical protein